VMCGLDIRQERARGNAIIDYGFISSLPMHQLVGCSARRAGPCIRSATCPGIRRRRCVFDPRARMRPSAQHHMVDDSDIYDGMTLRGTTSRALSRSTDRRRWTCHCERRVVAA
jgi:hypothetical protein